MELVEKREFSDKKRKELADKGHAMPDGSFPIENTTDLHNAIQSIGRAKDYAKAKAHIISRARDLGATKMLPEDWKIQKFISELKEAFEKSIGTTSSANQEADERSVENYVRQSANVNTRLDYNTGTSLDNIGGSIVSNTTEPDPKGNIAVQKDLPNATRPDAPAIVDQETRPYGDVTPSAAEHNVPDVSTDGAGIYKSGMTCPDCGHAVEHKCAVDKADEAETDDKVEKAASTDEVTEDSDEDDNINKAHANNIDQSSNQTKDQLQKSIWGGAFAPVNLK